MGFAIHQALFPQHDNIEMGGWGGGGGGGWKRVKIELPYRNEWEYISTVLSKIVD